MSLHAATADPFRMALIGVPNCGKTALFNRLTGSRQKVANYAGVTVERKEGRCHRPVARAPRYRVLDLPGAYSLTPTTLDEAITRDLRAWPAGGRGCRPNSSSASSMRPTCGSTCDSSLELQAPRPADDRGAEHERHRARARHPHRSGRRSPRELGVPVVETVAVRRGGERQLIERLERLRSAGAATAHELERPGPRARSRRTQREVRRILGRIGYREPLRARALARTRRGRDASGRGPGACWPCCCSWCSRPCSAGRPCRWT